MKKLFYYAFAVMTAMCMTACSSDDDDDKGGNTTKEANLPKPKNADNAAQFILSAPMACVVEPGVEENPNAPQLQTIDITESSELLLELRHPVSGQIEYFKEKATVNGNVYTVNGKNIKGTVKVVEDGARLTRAGVTTHLELDIEVKFTETEVYKYTTEEGSTITVIKETPLTGDQAMEKLARTWNILGIILDLKGDDIKAYEKWEAKNGLVDLRTTVLEEVDNRDVDLNEDERDELKKTVKSVTITSSRLITIDYTDANSDVATWEWANSEKTMIRIKLKDGKMGNKFIQDATLISFDFNGDRCNMKMATTFDDNSGKNWDVKLTVQMQAPLN